MVVADNKNFFAGIARPRVFAAVLDFVNYQAFALLYARKAQETCNIRGFYYRALHFFEPGGNLYV